MDLVRFYEKIVDRLALLKEYEQALYSRG